MDRLKTLADHNAESHARHSNNSNDPRLNGIACPTCGNELLDSSPMMALMSNPPKLNVHCGACDYVGYRVA